MKALALSIALSVLCLFGVATADDNFRPLRSSRCTTHCNTAVAVQQVIATPAYVPTYVQLVPAQVVVNGQVTSYNTGFSYSYTPAPQAVAQTYQPQGVQAQSAPSPCSQLEERVKQLEALLKGSASTSSVPPPPTPEAPVAAETTDSFVKSFLTTNCAKCHTPGHKGAEALTLTSADGLLLEKLPRAAIYKAINKQPHEPGFMPQGGAPVSDEIKQKILTWVEEGLDGLNY
jgi:mono/diheme cytochrome c family protein